MFFLCNSANSRGFMRRSFSYSAAFFFCLNQIRSQFLHKFININHPSTFHLMPHVNTSVLYAAMHLLLFFITIIIPHFVDFVQAVCLIIYYLLSNAPPGETQSSRQIRLCSLLFRILFCRRS